MESAFTCLRCLGASTSAGDSRTIAPLTRKAFKAYRRSRRPPARFSAPIPFSTQAASQHARSRQSTTTSTTASPAAVDDYSFTRPPHDSFERRNLLPSYEADVSAYSKLLLKPNDLFHPFSKSPIPAIRQRAAFTRQHAYCPHPSHQQTRLPHSPHDPETRKGPATSTEPPAHVKFECPDCGIATYCSEDHWADDYEAHLEICDTLRQINEDDHDLRSGRWFPEFDYPGPQMEEMLVNLLSWDTYLYTRGFVAINSERSMRQVTRLLTYPLTIGSILHEFSPYSVRPGGRLTMEGLKSMAGMSRAASSLPFH